MNSNFSPGLGAGTIFQAAKRIVAELLRSLGLQDYVYFIVFDSTMIIQLSPSAVILKPSYNYPISCKSHFSSSAIQCPQY